MHVSKSDTSRRRINLVSMVAAVLLGLISVGSASAPGADGRIAPGGDYPAFYAAGSIVADGHGSAALYDAEVQHNYQIPLIGPATRPLPFSYPAQFALAYAPLSMLSYRLSAALNSLLMLAAALAAVLLVRPMVPLVHDWPGVAAVLLVAFPLLTTSLVMGQNTSLTLFLLAWVWRSLHDDNEMAAGTAVALMMFRPQYGLPILGLLLIGRHYRAVASAGAAMMLIWGTTAVAVGGGWISDWTSFASRFVAGDGDDRAVFLVSPLGFLRSALGENSSAAVVIGTAVSVAAAAALAWLWSKRSVPLDLLMATTAVGVVVTSPHSGGFAPTFALIWVTVAVSRDRSRWHLIPLAMIAGMFSQMEIGTLAGEAVAAMLVAVAFASSFLQAAAAAKVEATITPERDLVSAGIIKSRRAALP